MNENKIAPSFYWMLKQRAFFALGFGTGLAPVMPGTVGSLPGLVLAWGGSKLALEWQVVLGLFLLIYGIRACGQVATALGEHDHKAIVCDEIAGMYFVAISVPYSLLNWTIAFLFFRLWDIMKPWPISWCDRNVKGGLGIMLDDVMAAVLAIPCVHFSLTFI